MMEPHQSSSSQAGDSHIFQELTETNIPKDISKLGEVERSNQESSKIKLQDVDKATAMIRKGP